MANCGITLDYGQVMNVKKSKVHGSIPIFATNFFF